MRARRSDRARSRESSPCLRCVLGSCLVLLLLVSAAAGETLQRGVFLIHFDPADRELAEQSLEVLEAALPALARRLPPGPVPINVYLCATHREFARFAGSLARVNVGGIANPSRGLIAVKTPRLKPSGLDYEGTLRHELVHVLLERNVEIANLPRWLNEGIAMTLSREFRWGSAFIVGEMYLRGRILSYQDLGLVLDNAGREMEFSDAYAQSLSMTRFLVKYLGDDDFWRVIAALKTVPFGRALREQTDLDVHAFMNAWRNSLWRVALVSSVVSGFGVFQMAALLTVLAYIRKRRQGQRIVKAWQEDEEEGGPVPHVWDQAERESQYPWEDKEEEEEPW